MNRPLTVSGAAALVLGVVCYFGLVHAAIDDAMEHASTSFGEELRLPPSVTLDLPEPGTYFVWHVYETEVDGERHEVDRRLPSGVAFTVLAPGDRPVPLESSSVQNFNVNDTRQSLLGRFEVSEPGQYTFDLTGDEVSTRVFGITDGNVGEVATALFGGCVGIAATGVLGLAGVILLIVGLSLSGPKQPEVLEE